MKNRKLLTVLALTVIAAGLMAAPQGASATTADSYWGPIDAKLHSLEGTQSAAAIDQLMAGGGNVQALVDPDTGETLAAFRMSERALTPVAPGCSTTSACMVSSTNVPYGYSGSGTRTSKWLNIVRVSAGDRRTGYAASNGAAYNYNPGVTA